MLKKCGGCGNRDAKDLQEVRDKKKNRGFLCDACKKEYGHLLKPDSIRRFWMCKACGYRILAGTKIDAKVDELNGKCPNCGGNINITLVNLSNDRPVESGIIGEPLD
jgi:protein-arginine kinase activator protein McsA